MRYLQLLILSLFFAVLTNGRTQYDFAARFSGIACIQDHTAARVHLKPDHKIRFVKNPIVHNKHKKYKTKGVEVPVPSITARRFVRVPVYTECSPLFFSGSYASFLYCVDRKRGPPQNLNS